MPDMTPVAADDPLMLAWNAYKGSEAYHNTHRWMIEHACDDQSIDGDIWGVFEAGFRAGAEAPAEDRLARCAAIIAYIR